MYQTTRRHVPEERYLELLPLLLLVYAVLCLVSVVTGSYCTVGTTSAKSSIHRKCRKRVFAISSLLCARAASCREDVALKLDYCSKCCFTNDSNNNYCTRGLLADLPFFQTSIWTCPCPWQVSFASYSAQKSIENVNLQSSIQCTCFENILLIYLAFCECISDPIHCRLLTA
jgi:hypothetical protein